MLIFNLTVHHLWGRVLAKFEEARVIAYADDDYIKTKLSVALQVLPELKHVLKHVLKQDAGLEITVSPLMWRRTSYKLPPLWLTSVGTFSSNLLS